MGCISKLLSFENPKEKQVFLWYFAHLFVTLHPILCKVCCRDGGMVDTRDLKSLGHNGCAGSSPARGTDAGIPH